MSDTKAVVRWNSWGGERDIQESDDGQFVLFTDHERVVGELREYHEGYREAATEETLRLREALAASRAEAEALRREMGMLIQDSSEARERDRLQYDCGEL